MPGQFPIVGDLLELKVYCYESTLLQVGINTTHWVVTGSTVPGAINLIYIAQHWGIPMRVVYRPWMSAGSSYLGVGVRNLSPPQTSEIVDSSNPGAGTASGNSLPLQVSGLLSFRTGLAGRANRGRIYPPFPSTAFSDANGAMNAGGVAVLNTMTSIYQSGLSPVTSGTAVMNFQQVIRHGKGLTYTPISLWETVGVFATQRRRGQEGRANGLPF